MTATTAAPLRVALTSLGCKVNFAEIADLAGALAAAGCDVVPDHEPADVRVLNSCTVTLQADATTRQRLHRLRRLDPGAYIVLTGCSVDGNPDRYQQVDMSGNLLPVAGVDAVFANRDKADIADHIVELAARRCESATSTALPKLRSRAFIKAQDGCNHSCTYCIVWRARGASRSVPVDAVLDRCRRAVADGYRELVFCGVDLGSYGRDLGTTLASLLERALHAVGDAARIRLSSVNANDVTPALMELNAHPRLCSHWHMPLQSGSDNVLRAMQRGYRRAQYLRVVDGLRARDTHTEFTTDVMVAFPGETDDDHGQTLSLIDAVGFLSCHVFRWSPRPGTPASVLDGRAPEAVARRRSAEARQSAAVSGARSLQRACGREHEVVWDAVEDGVAHGIAATYHEVVVEADATIRTGQLARVRAVQVEDDRLRATLLR
jgi:threonylcarbamoyladenosine tRNA methylthiotransferase MtaB